MHSVFLCAAKGNRWCQEFDSGKRLSYRNTKYEDLIYNVTDAIGNLQCFIIYTYTFSMPGRPVRFGGFRDETVIIWPGWTTELVEWADCWLERWSIAEDGGGGGGGGEGEQLNIGGGGITPISVTANDAINSAPSIPMFPFIPFWFTTLFISPEVGSTIGSIKPLFPEWWLGVTLSFGSIDKGFTILPPVITNSNEKVERRHQQHEFW